MAACSCEPVDRVPFSLWYHFRLNPPTGSGMVNAELDFYRRYQPDLFKVMHDTDYEPLPGGAALESAKDWRGIPALDGVSGNFGRQLDTIKHILAGRSDDVPVVETVFSIFSSAQKVSGKRTLAFLDEDSESVHAGLRNLAESISNYVRALMRAGVDGIYLAISGAASDTMDVDTYRRHFLQYDQQILNAAAGAALNVVHHHGAGIYPELVLGLEGYRVYSWSDRLEGNPSIREMRLKSSACLMAGVDESRFTEMSPAEIAQQARDAAAQVDGKGVIVAPGCAVPTPPESTDQNLRAIREGIEG
jgi:uroporphyrinogen decarboxylase